VQHKRCAIPIFRGERKVKSLFRDKRSDLPYTGGRRDELRNNAAGGDKEKNLRSIRQEKYRKKKGATASAWGVRGLLDADDGGCA